MFSTETNYEEWIQERRISFESYKDELPKVPTEPEAKKEYVVLCTSKEDWEHVHEILMQDGTLEDNIPTRHVDCTSECNHSDVRGIYLLDDDEVAQLKNHPKVLGVNINHGSYPGSFMDNPDDLTCEFSTPLTKTNRYPSNVWCQGSINRNFYLNFTPGADLKNRGSSQIIRHMQRESPFVSLWWSNPDNLSGIAATPGAYVQLGNRLPQYGTGKDVDVIVCDQDMWFGHIEFQNTLGISTLTSADVPSNYVGGNALSNRGISPNSGTCDLLDLTLDAPMYLDPDFFNARLDVYWNGPVGNVVGDGSDFFKREVTTNGVRIMGAGTVGGQTAVPDAWLEKVGRMFELFTNPSGPAGVATVGINTTFQKGLINTLSGETGTYHAGLPTIQRVARGAGADYTPNFLTDEGVVFWNLTNLFDTHVQNDMVWYLNSTGSGYGDGDLDAQEVIEHVFHTLHMHGLPADDIKLYPYISSDWNTGDLYAAMEEAYDAGKWDPSGYQSPSNAWKTDADAFEVAAKEYLYLLNFCMFEYTELWEGGSLAPEWTDDMRTQLGIQANNPLGYAFFNTWMAPIITKPSLTTIRSIFQDGNTPDQDDPTLAGASGYVVDNNGRTETRWDGTTVPTDVAARNWWRNNSTTYRSPKYVSVGIGSGTAVPGSAQDFGAILVNNGYSRQVCNGNHTTYQTGTGYHATPCASQAYGRQYGWAYNSNKWFLNHYGTNNSGWEVGFDQQKVFHQCKPINPAYGTQDPTISSNSWGHRLTPDSTGWISHRNNVTGDGTGQAKLDGSDMVQYNSKPNCLVAYNNTDMGIAYATDNSVIQAGKELVDSGVIYCYAAGNHDQKQVRGDHPDFNNYYSDQNEDIESARRNALYSSMFGTQYYTFYNRPGFPGHIGERTDDNGVSYYKTIAVGALDETGVTSGVGTYYREAKTFYTNTGNAVDCWTLCDNSLSACDDNTGTRYNRYDAFYTLGGIQSVESEDRLFNGTSSATPIAVGLIATKLEYNRHWTWADVKGWFNTLGSFESIRDAAGTLAVYTGTEGGSNINDTNYLDSYNLQGSDAPLLWDAPTGNEPNISKLIEGGSDPISFTGNITIKIVE